MHRLYINGIKEKRKKILKNLHFFINRYRVFIIVLGSDT